MARYKTSHGTYIEKKTIDRLVREAKKYKLDSFYEDHGYHYCEECGRNATVFRIDCSHDISVDQCQKQGTAELAYNVDNITLRCRLCHNIHDKTY
jgi:hypothetical protein